MVNTNVGQPVEQPKKVSATEPPPKKDLPTKIIVAVHGIGDQFQFATIQSVVNRFCVVGGNPQALPLGRFYDLPIGKPPETYLARVVIDEQSKENYGFVEIYWADIPRIPQKEGYTLEEAKKWAKTVVDRLRPHCSSDPKQLSATDLEMAREVLEEMIETITVVERLLLIAEKAGLFKFNLKDILVSYLGDVQLVADFKKYREQILYRFFAVMNYVAKFNSEAEIYIVAHSEGTVVAFLSLLAAVCDKPPGDAPDPNLSCAWIRQVSGLMTIGSPIDKHLILWPDLWTQFENSTHPNSPDHKILWRNYYDYGDPIGFKLDTARDWLCECRFESVFEFPSSHDHGFGRYAFPGKAHNDYWNDNDVFDHFIETVVRAKTIKPGTQTSMCSEKDLPAPKAKPDGPKPPADRKLTKFLGNVIPYVLVFGLILLGVYFLYKAVNEYERVDDDDIDIAKNVVGMACLLAGLTVVAQIPRLTRVWKWRFAACAIFAASAVGYWFIPLCRAHMRLGCFLASRFWKEPTEEQATASVLALATVIAIAVYVVGRKWPRAGMKILLGLGFLALVLTVGVGFWKKAPTCPCPDHTVQTAGIRPLGTAGPGQVATGAADASKRPIWPLVLATAAFLYLWRLAALIFDLVVVWHYYIRRSVALDQLRILHKKTRSRAEALSRAS